MLGTAWEVLGGGLGSRSVVGVNQLLRRDDAGILDLCKVSKSGLPKRLRSREGGALLVEAQWKDAAGPLITASVE